MSESLKASMLRLASSKKTWRLKLIYHFKALVFYPFLMLEKRNAPSKNGAAQSVSTDGDDVYPLF